MENSIVVVGSCMMDFVCYAPRLPNEGETIHGTTFATNFGGKGANQCIAAAKLGGKTTLIARVGDDIWGDNYIKNFKDYDVNHEYVKKSIDHSNGIAQITVSDSGANQIVIVAGANKYLSVEDVEDAKQNIERAGVIICQLETAPEVAIRAMELCRGISILNGAPALPNCDKKLLTLPSIFCVNESEASVFTGIPVKTIEDSKLAIEVLLEKGCQCVILTLGAEGAVFASQKDARPEHVESPKIENVDSTGAGDCFIGALAYLLANRKDLSMKICVGAACYAAADSCRRRGTQNSFPDLEILNEYFKKRTL